MLTHSLQPETLLDASQIEAAVAALKQGALVAFPTETVYGLGADAESPAALDRLYAVKGRPKGHPVIVHLSSIQQLSDWAEDIPAMAWRLAEAFWPGPLTLILKRSSRVPDAVTGGQDTVGIRVPAHPVALQLLEAFGGGVAAPSANRFGRLSPTRAAHVQADLGDDVQMVLDGGDCQVGVESTIVAFQDGRLVILRPGMITAEQIESILSADVIAPEIQPDSTKAINDSQSNLSESNASSIESGVIRAPGTLASHYAPRTPLRLVPSRDLAALTMEQIPPDSVIGVLARQPQPVAVSGVERLIWVSLDDQPEVVARELYAQLRDLDQRNLREIWVEAVPEAGPWAAVADRLRRAAHQD